jgi:hypothetical protein
MEERPKAPSIVSDLLPASADPRGVSAAHTRRLSAPNRLKRRAFPLTFWRAACAPFRSDADFPASLRPSPELWARFSTAPRDPSSGGDGLPPSASADRTVCDGLARPVPTYLAAVRGARARCVPIDFCFPLLHYEHSRLSCSQHLSEACASPLSHGFAPGKTDWGTLRFTLPGSASAGCSGSRAAFSAARPRTNRTSDISVARPSSCPMLPHRTLPRPCQDYVGKCPVKGSLRR